MKGKVYLREEEEQLCRSVMHVSQDQIIGNQQRVGVFWERRLRALRRQHACWFEASEVLENEMGQCEAQRKQVDWGV